MKLTKAIHVVASGAAVVSAIGRRYTAAELAPKLLGKHAASFNSVGMTKAEREGEWRIECS